MRGAHARHATPAAVLLTLGVLLAGCGGASDAPPPRAAPLAIPAPSPTSTPDPDPDPVADPVGITIPAIGVDAAIVGVGLDIDGSMQTPDFGSAGWYTEGPRPGERGPAVIVAHVDSRSGPDVFHRLRGLTPGDAIVVEHADGGHARFVVLGSEQSDKDELPTDRIWNAATEPVLRLITCGGAFDDRTRHYEDNVIVYAAAA